MLEPACRPCHFDLSLIHISEPTRRTPISYAVFCLKKKTTPPPPKTFVKGSAEAHETRVQNLRVYLSKRRGHWTLKEFGVLCLNQPVGHAILIIEFVLSFFYLSRSRSGFGCCTKGVPLPPQGGILPPKVLGAHPYCGIMDHSGKFPRKRGCS